MKFNDSSKYEQFKNVPLNYKDTVDIHDEESFFRYKNIGYNFNPVIVGRKNILKDVSPIKKIRIFTQINDDDEIIAILNRMLNVKYVYCNKASIRLVELSSIRDGLTRLDIYGDRIALSPDIVFSKLKTICASCDISLKKENVPQLRKICVLMKNSKDDPSYIYEINTVKHLSIGIFNNGQLAKIEQLKRLQTLSLIGMGRIDNCEMSRLELLVNIKSLELIGMKNIVNIKSIIKLYNLEYLKIDGFNNINESVIEEIVNLEKLKYLNIVRCGEIDISKFVEVFEKRKIEWVVR